MIFIVACGNKKAEHSIQARNMYIGAYFKVCLKYAESQQNNSIYILSAKYGIVELQEIIEPYNLIIDDINAVSIEHVNNQAKEKGLLNEKVIVIGGKKYVNFAKKIWQDVSCPLQGGLLSQMSWLNKQVEIEKAKKQMELWK